jgi:hypothetical protein
MLKPDVSFDATLFTTVVSVTSMLVMFPNIAEPRGALLEDIIDDLIDTVFELPATCSPPPLSVASLFAIRTVSN